MTMRDISFMVPRLKLKRILLGVIVGSGVVVAGILVLIHTLGDHDTMYKGKSLDFWMAQLKSEQPGASNEARLVLDTVALPQLVQAMFSDTNDSSIRLMLIDQLNCLPGVTIHYTPADGRRAEAAQDLGSFGPNAKAAVPSLVKALKGEDPVIRAPAALALGKIHSEPQSIIPLLIAAINDPQEDVPAAAIEALGNFGSLSKDAVPKILPLLKVPDKDTRRAANVAIRKIDPQAVEQR